MYAGKKRQLERGMYLLPSLLTIGNMFLGFLGLITGLDGNYQLASILVFVAAAVDGMDGRFARGLGLDSEFGKQYDSLADLLTFGAVPALLAYFWGLRDLDRIGWLIPFFFIVCCATRLARFNVQSSTVDRRFFVGLPAPAAAGLLGSILFFAPRTPEWRPQMQGLLIMALVLLGLLMLSTFRYYSFKELNPKRRWSYRVVVPILLLILLVAYDPGTFFLVVSGTYAASGPLGWLRSRLRRQPDILSKATDDRTPGVGP